MDIVYIRELEIETIIGIYDWEREQKQTVNLDLEMGTDISLAASSEDIEKTLDYKAVAKRLIEFVEGSLALIEAAVPVEPTTTLDVELLLSQVDAGAACRESDHFLPFI